MSSLLRRSSTRISCYYCNAKLKIKALNSRNGFVCTECHCLNRYDERGIIVGDEPAMREENLNMISFARRASPSKNVFPTANRSNTPFCHTCRTNQSLLVNLLSNYLPDPSDRTYEARLAEFPHYQKGLQERYPPVCADCQPMVDEEIKKKDFMAQTHALGYSMQQSRRMFEKRPARYAAFVWEVWLWRLRGLLWILTCMACILGSALVLYDPNTILHLKQIPLLPFLYPMSVLWTFWNPKWHAVRKASISGHPVKLRGLSRYRQLQTLLWLFRWLGVTLLAAIVAGKSNISPFLPAACLLAMEIVIGTLALRSISIVRPAPIRLISTRNTPAPPDLRSPSPQSFSPSDPDALLSTLSISRKQPLTSPMFGQPSLPNSVPPSVMVNDVMDWTPVNPMDLQPSTSNLPPSEGEYKPVFDREGWMRQPTFYAPEKPTGLEDLFQSTTITTRTPMLPMAPLRRNEVSPADFRKRIILAGLGVAFLSMVGGVFLYWKQQ